MKYLKYKNCKLLRDNLSAGRKVVLEKFCDLALNRSEEK